MTKPGEGTTQRPARRKPADYRLRFVASGLPMPSDPLKALLSAGRTAGAKLAFARSLDSALLSASEKVDPRRNRRRAEQEPTIRRLLVKLRRALPQLEELLAIYSSHWGYEDAIYRFYYMSFKVYRLQEATEDMVAALQALLPKCPLTKRLQQIVMEGTGKKFELEVNARWLVETRPIVEAFFHARYFLELAVRCGRRLKRRPRSLPSRCVGLLCLYDLR